MPSPRLELDIGIRVATSHRDLHEANPLGRIWLPIDDDRRRALTDLAIPSRSFVGGPSEPGGDQ